MCLFRPRCHLLVGMIASWTMPAQYLRLMLNVPDLQCFAYGCHFVVACGSCWKRRWLWSRWFASWSSQVFQLHCSSFDRQGKFLATWQHFRIFSCWSLLPLCKSASRPNFHLALWPLPINFAHHYHKNQAWCCQWCPQHYFALPSAWIQLRHPRFCSHDLRWAGFNLHLLSCLFHNPTQISYQNLARPIY